MSIHPAFALIAQALPQQASSALISSLWESVLLATATALFLHVLPQTTARLRFLVWSAVFLLLTALPLLNISLVTHSTGTPIEAAPLRLDPRWSYALTAIWLSAVAIRATHLAIQAIKLRSLWNSAIPISPARLPGAPCLDLETWDVSRPPSAIFHPFQASGRKVQICTSAQLDRPSVIGFFAPRILIPAWLVDQLTRAELHQIVLHELEHLRRRDDWLNLLQKLSLVVFPLNPALLWIDRRLATERELACDDGVLERTHAPRAYATCLTSLAERRLAHRQGGRLTALALGAIGIFRRSEFSRRIESILNSRPTVNSTPARASLAFAALVMLGFVAVAARAPQLVSFTAVNPQQQAIVFPQPYQATSTNIQQLTVKPQVQFLNAAFHAPATSSLHTQKKKKASVSRSVKTAQAVAAAPQPSERHWMVLTSWHEAAPLPVIVTLPDGRRFLTTYPAMPTQVDWLLVQL